MTPEAHGAESPFVTIWEAPRATIRRVVETNPRRWVNRLFFAAGGVGALDAGAESFGATAHPIMVVPVVVMVGLLNIGFAHLNAWYKRWVGSLLGGEATRIEIAAVSAWAAVPIIVGHGVLWLIQIALYGGEAFAPVRPEVAASSQLLRTSFWLGAMLFALWSAVVSILGFAEVNRFSIARSIATSVLAFTLVATVATIVAVPLLVLLRDQ